MKWLKHVRMRLKASGAVAAITLGVVGMTAIAVTAMVGADKGAIGIGMGVALLLLFICRETIEAWQSISERDAEEETKREVARQKARVAEALIAKCSSVEELKEVIKDYNEREDQN